MTDTPEEKLLAILDPVNLVKEVYNSLTIEETDKSGQGRVTFKNPSFISFSPVTIGTTAFNNFFKKDEARGNVFRKICDGIFLTRLNGEYILCLVELKNNLNAKFNKAIKQIEGSYLKTAMLLSLFYNLNDIRVVVFLAGHLKKKENDPDMDFLEKAGEFRDIENTPESKWKEFVAKRRTYMDFPFFLTPFIHRYYCKNKISVYHLEMGETFNITDL
ncbi:MAG: hypothetical protein GY940_31595 [bacterium]|nr:hypothetical protein [bacterium]